MKFIWMLLAIVFALGCAPSFAAEKPTLFERYLHRIADKPKIAPRTYTQVPGGRKAEEFYSCGADYCEESDVCCTNQTDWSSYCCPGGYRCDAYGGCW